MPLLIVDRHEHALLTFDFASCEEGVLPCDPIDRTTDVATSNDLMLPSKPPVKICDVSDDDDDDEPVETANDNSGPDLTLCVRSNGALSVALVSWIRTAPSQLDDANKVLLVEDRK